MSTYNTGNPLGSTDPKDLYDNAQNLDEAVNSTADTWEDRLGNERLTLAKAIQLQSTGEVNVYFAETKSAADTLAASLPDEATVIVDRDETRNFERTRYTVAAGLPTNPVDDTSFVQAGVGAVTRTMQDKSRDDLDIFDFMTDALKADAQTGSPVLDHTTSIVEAIAEAKLSGRRLTGRGVFSTNAKIVINCAFDGSDMTFRVKDAPAVAVEVSTGSAANPTDIFSLTTELGIILPSVINTTKPVTGWAGQGIGVRYVNIQNMKITERLVENFAVGVLHTSFTQGCGYTNVQGGYLRNNGVNRRATIGDASGAFTNRWDIYGGRYFHSSAEGTEVAGVMHIDIDAPSAGNIINDFNFFGASLEGNAQQYHVRVGGNAINFVGCRWESTAPGGIKIHLAYGGIAGQGSCAIVMGRGVAETAFNITKDVGAAGRVAIHSASNGGLISVPNPAYALQNVQSSADPAMVAYEASTDPFSSSPLSDYAAVFGPQKIGGKREADLFDRVYINPNNGRVYVGNGTAAAQAYIGPLGTVGAVMQGAWYMVDGVTAPATITGFAAIYVDSADGDLKIKFGDGVIKTIVTDV